MKRWRGSAIAFAGAVLSAGAEAWHAVAHLRLDTHSAPLAGILSVVGFVVVAAAMVAAARAGRGRAESTSNGRRAA